MKPIVKKALAAVAIKEAVERIAEARRPPKPSKLARLAKFTLFAGIIGAGWYAYRSGLFSGLLGREDRYESSLRYEGPRDDYSPSTTATTSEATKSLSETTTGESDPIPSPS